MPVLPRNVAKSTEVTELWYTVIKTSRSRKKKIYFISASLLQHTNTDIHGSNKRKMAYF